MTDELIANLGPLAPLMGIWEGSKGDDIAPSDDRGIENNKYRERMTFEPISRTENHEQVLYGLRYSTTAWRLDEENPFHEDLGYWLWDVKEKQVMKCFVIPRGITIIAGGTVERGAKSFSISAKTGSGTYGLCHNLFLEKEFKIMGFTLKIDIHSPTSFSYEQNTLLLLKGKSEFFDHRDKNTLVKK